jgi:hypothetical protein
VLTGRVPNPTLEPPLAAPLARVSPAATRTRMSHTILAKSMHALCGAYLVCQPLLPLLQAPASPASCPSGPQPVSSRLMDTTNLQTRHPHHEAAGQQALLHISVGQAIKNPWDQRARETRQQRTAGCGRGGRHYAVDRGRRPPARPCLKSSNTGG